jgi:hypothetical protein
MLIPLVVSKLCPGQEKLTDGQKARRRLYALPNFSGSIIKYKRIKIKHKIDK